MAFCIGFYAYAIIVHTRADQLLPQLLMEQLEDPAAGADPGFLERGFICIMVWEGRFADFISFYLNIP